MRYSTKAFQCHLCQQFATRCIVLADDTRLWYCNQHLEAGHEVDRLLRDAWRATEDFPQACGLLRIILDERGEPPPEELAF